MLRSELTQRASLAANKVQASAGKSEKSLGIPRITLVRGEIPLLYSESTSSRREGAKWIW